MRLLKYPNSLTSVRQRPYHVEHSASRPISEVKQRWVWLELGWVTAWEHQVLLASDILYYYYFFFFSFDFPIPYLCGCFMKFDLHRCRKR